MTASCTWWLRLLVDWFEREKNVTKQNKTKQQRKKTYKRKMLKVFTTIVKTFWYWEIKCHLSGWYMLFSLCDKMQKSSLDQTGDVMEFMDHFRCIYGHPQMRFYFYFYCYDFLSKNSNISYKWTNRTYTIFSLFLRVLDGTFESLYRNVYKTFC